MQGERDPSTVGGAKHGDGDGEHSVQAGAEQQQEQRALVIINPDEIDQKQHGEHLDHNYLEKANLGVAQQIQREQRPEDSGAGGAMPSRKQRKARRQEWRSNSERQEWWSKSQCSWPLGTDGFDQVKASYPSPFGNGRPPHTHGSAFLLYYLCIAINNDEGWPISPASVATIAASKWIICQCAKM